MKVINGTCLEDNYKKIIKLILEEGKHRFIKEQDTLELSPFAYSTDKPLQNILTNKKREINRAFSIAEFLWILSGRNDVELVSFYNSKMIKYSDNSGSLRGAYGPLVEPQLEYIIKTLRQDKNSRQAVVSLWKPSPTFSLDIPCTLTMHFIVNSLDELDLIVNMRSNDAWLGFPYDIYNFTMIQNYVAFMLCKKMGKYTHVASSMHLYECHFEKARSLSDEPTFVRDIKESEQMTSMNLKEILDIEQRARIYHDFNLSKCDSLSKPWNEMAKTLILYCEKKLMKGPHA